MDYKIKEEIKSKYNIDLSKSIDLTNDMFIGVEYQSIFKQYFIQISQFIANDIDRFYFIFENDVTHLRFDSEYITDFNEHIQLTDLGEFEVASKELKNDEYIWRIYVNDRFGSAIETVDFNSDNFIYKYLDAVVKYCSEVGNKIIR